MSINRVWRGYTLQSFGQAVIIGKMKKTCPRAGYPLPPALVSAA